MLKNKLKIALAVTIAMLAGVFYFGNSNLSAGQIATLCLGALAWLALLLKPDSVSHSRNQLVATPQANNEELSSSISALLNTFESELSTQISATAAELAQVKSNMEGAINDLVDSFISLEASARTEQKLLMLLASNETVNDSDELNPFREKQLKSKQLLREASEKLNEMVEVAKHNEIACKSLSSIEGDAEKSIEKLEAVLDKLAKTTDTEQVTKIREGAKVLHASVTNANKIITQLHASSTLLTKESKDISHKVAAFIDENNSNIAMVASEMAVSTKQIETDVQTALKSLQFQDMATQLIVQCDERMKVMQEMLRAVHPIIGSASQNSTSDLQAKLNMARDMLKQASNVRMKQFNVDAGHVELFD